MFLCLFRQLKNVFRIYTGLVIIIWVSVAEMSVVVGVLLGPANRWGDLNTFSK